MEVKGVMVIKDYLLAPGPTQVPPDVLLKMAEPIIHHRAPAFVELFSQVREGLKYIFQTKNEVLCLASSGTGAMESAIVNTLSAGDKALIINGGKFGERWGNICKAYGVNTTIINVEWGKAVDPKVVEEHLQKEPDIKAVCVQASETSTGVRHDVETIGKIVAKKLNTICIVDAITGLGVFDIKTDEWGLDIVVSGSQKAFMLPPGLAFITMSDKAWKLNETSKLPKFYFDMKKERKNHLENQTAYTPAVSLIMGLHTVIEKIKKEGLQNVFARHAKLAHATREAMKALGLKLLAPESPSDALTAVYAPEGVSGGDIVKTLRNQHRMTIAGGQDSLKGKIFRIAHLGYADQFDVINAVSAVEMTLKKLGYPVELGKGVKRALEILGN